MIESGEGWSSQWRRAGKAACSHQAKKEIAFSVIVPLGNVCIVVQTTFDKIFSVSGLVLELVFNIPSNMSVVFFHKKKVRK